MFSNLFIICLSVFLLLFGIAHVTNIQVVWMTPIMGLAALVAGVVGIISIVRKTP